MKRMTKQRLAILNCFTKELQRPMSIEEVLSAVAETIPGINLSTVYRNIKILIADSKLRSVELPGGGVRYEMLKKETSPPFFVYAM